MSINWSHWKNIWGLPALALLCALVGTPVASQAADIDLIGRLQLDFEAYSGGFGDGAEKTNLDFFDRRLRLGAEGEIDENWSFRFEIDVRDNGSEDVHEAYITYNGLGDLLGFGNLSLSLGKRQAPFGLQSQVSSNDTPVLERSPSANAFDSAELYGLRIDGYGNNHSYAIGIYEGPISGSGDFNASFFARGVITPINSDNRLLHLGLSYAHHEAIGLANPKSGQIYAARAIGSNLLNATVAGSSPASTIDEAQTVSADQISLEVAFVADSLYLQGEYFHSKYDGLDGYTGHDRDEANALYVQFGLFLTGETRSYDNKTGIFGSVTPNGSNGALEGYIQYSHLDLGTDLKQEYEVDTVSAGLNWYANERVRIGAAFIIGIGDNKQLDYVGRGFKARAQIAF